MLNPLLEGVTWYRIDFPEADVLVSVKNGRVYTTPKSYKSLKGKRIAKLKKKYKIKKVQKA